MRRNENSRQAQKTKKTTISHQINVRIGLFLKKEARKRGIIPVYEAPMYSSQLADISRKKDRKINDNAARSARKKAAIPNTLSLLSVSALSHNMCFKNITQT